MVESSIDEIMKWSKRYNSKDDESVVDERVKLSLFEVAELAGFADIEPGDE